MSKIKAKLKIELKSDLCTGSGYGYAGVIDTDVVFDCYGLPMIPARRLKGCMREAAQLVCVNKIDSLFGKGGENRAEGIVLGNAYIENYREIIHELQQIKRKRPDVYKYISQYTLLELFTQIRAQTKIDSVTGIAEDNSLRYMRVIGQYNPMEKEESLCFYADIEYDSEEGEDIRKVVKATRNIGMSRNRGLGSVQCSIVSEEEKKSLMKKNMGRKKPKVKHVLHIS